MSLFKCFLWHASKIMDRKMSANHTTSKETLTQWNDWALGMSYEKLFFFSYPSLYAWVYAISKVWPASPGVPWRLGKKQLLEWGESSDLKHQTRTLFPLHQACLCHTKSFGFKMGQMTKSFNFVQLGRGKDYSQMMYTILCASRGTKPQTWITQKWLNTMHY